ncbi:MAG: thioredoxin [Spirochaetaceae bacterium]|nr:MAG: thioredoxin [Spirochaetaceae bacterium]
MVQSVMAPFTRRRLRGPRRAYCASFLLTLASLAAAFTAAPLAADEGPTLYYFWQQGCPHCEAMAPWLNTLATEYPALQISKIEVGRTPEGLDLLRELSAKYGITRLGVPAVFLGHRAWVGFNPTVTAGIRLAAAECVTDGCIDALSDPLPERQLVDDGGAAGDAGAAASGAGADDVDRDRFESMPLYAATALIALLDGINPCSLWVLTFLLGMVVHTGSRRKMLLVGSVFLVTTALIYGLFIVGVVQAMALLSFVPWIRVVVALLAFAMGAVNVKEFFVFGRGPSLSVSAAQKRRFGDRVRRLFASDRSPLALAGGTALLAAGIALVELPCTAGFPVIWSGLVVDAGVTLAAFAGLLALYLVIYLIDEAVIVGAATIAFRRLSMTETRGRRLKLIGGVVMIALGGAMLVAPALLETLAGTAILFGGAIALAVAVIVVESRIKRRPDARSAPGRSRRSRR